LRICDEGHGFSRAAKMIRLTASAAEVRFLKTRVHRLRICSPTTKDPLTIRSLKREDRYWFIVRVNVCA
jgi:hypothetical protein